MIGSLRGRLIARRVPVVVVECGGVGYEVETPMSTFLELPAEGGDVFIYTHLLVREDAQILYGFRDEEERALFRTLLKVNRVGAKMALGILSTLSVADFRRCVEYEDTAALSRVPGIGKKTAERLIVEMRDRIAAPATDGNGRAGQVAPASASAEASDALVALGYKPREVNGMIGAIDTQGLSAEDIIRRALRQAAG